MADIELSRTHGLELEDAKHKVETVLEDWKNDSKYIDTIDWNSDGTGATVSGKGFSGELTVDERQVEMSVNLKLFVKPFKSKIKQKVEGILDDHFG